MKTVLLLTACFGLVSCTFPTPGGGTGTITPGYYKTTTQDDPDGVWGYLVNVEPIVVTDEK